MTCLKSPPMARQSERMASRSLDRDALTTSTRLILGASVANNNPGAATPLQKAVQNALLFSIGAIVDHAAHIVKKGNV